MYLKRTAKNTLIQISKEFKAVAVTGPRQSGKTTLIKHVFPNKQYVNLENPDTREFASTDPRRFIAMYSQGAIFDEIQRVPKLFSYLQEILDNTKQKGMFILSGSQHFLLMEKISQSLAGRIGLLQLLPLSIQELKDEGFKQEDADDAMLMGSFPPVHTEKVSTYHWYNAYINTYVEKDMRQLLNIHDTLAFNRFLKLCAGNVGSLINLTRLGSDCSIDQKTAKAWIGILETSFIIYRLMPHHNNFRKRLIKSPKLYFYDTGLACRLLGIENTKQLSTHMMRGHLFENMIIGEMIKKRSNYAKDNNLYFWRSRDGHEVDVIFDQAGKLFPVEIKSGHTIASDWFESLDKWSKLAGDSAGRAHLIYGGSSSQKRTSANVVPWNESLEIF